MTLFYPTISYRGSSVLRQVLHILGVVVLVWATVAAPRRAQAQNPGPPMVRFFITQGTNIAITGPVAYTPGLTLQVGNTLSEFAGSSRINPAAITYDWDWTRNGDVIPNTRNAATLTVTQAGQYSVIQPDPANTTNSLCRCMYQAVDVFEGPALRGQPASYAAKTTVLKPGTTAARVATLGAGERTRTTTFTDGFGRAVQTIQQQAAPDQKDLVSFQEFDAYGQTPTAYLPYTRPSGTATQPVSNPTAEQATFYTSTPKVAADNFPSATVTMEASPLARPLQQTKPGAAWQAHAATQAYASNSGSEVRYWGEALQGSTFYPANSLAKATQVDEDGRRTDSFQDQLGRVVLRRQWKGQTAHDTYTVYNAAGLVRYVIPPAAVVAAATGGYDASATSFKQRWLYQYEYDAAGRLITRTFPGAAPVAMVYDRYDRLILTQDGNARQAGRWFFTKYDAQGRPAVEGIYTSGSTRATLQTAADNSTLAGYERRRAPGSGSIGYYTTGSYPGLADGVNARVLSTTYYDDYDLELDADAAPDYAYRSQGLGADEPVPVDQPRGRVTVTRRRIVNADNSYGGWLTAVSFYDAYGNVVQTQQNSHVDLSAALPNVTTVLYREHGFVPQVLRSIKSQNNGQVLVNNRFVYGPAGHLQQVWQQNSWAGGEQPEVLVAGYAYNALGQVVEKNLHSTDTGQSFLQSVDFRYDIQGALQSINNGALTNDGGVRNDDSNDVFGLELVRQAQDNDLLNEPRFDGGISGVRWQAHNARQQQQPERERSYVFTYDGLGRLTNAYFKARAAGATLFTQEMDAYNEKDITYDPNGNIQSLTRYSQATDNAASWSTIDRLTYAYDGNQLTTVSDAANPSAGFRSAGAGGAYAYDANGSVTTDPNKNASFTYNALNKVAVQTTATGSTTYLYDAAGTVLRRTVSTTATGQTQTVDYVDGFVYTTSSTYQGLLSLPTPEGRAVVLTTPVEPAVGTVGNPGSGRNPAPRLVYEYHLRDHLGNLRVAFRAEAVQQRLALRLESPAVEEGAYPRFANVSSTRSSAYAYEGKYSSAVSTTTAGPLTRIPVATGDAVKVDLFYLTPAGTQTSRPAAAPPALARWAPTVALTPVLLPAPARAPREAGATSGTRPGTTPGLQFSVSGLLSRVGKPGAPAPAPQGSGGGGTGPTGPTVSYEAAVGWRLYDEDNQLVTSGATLVPVTAFSPTQWTHFSTSIAVSASTGVGKGHLEVQLLNGGSQPVYFDSVSIRHPQVDVVVSQENHYYPFGMNLTGVAVNTRPGEARSKAQYNGGSELQDENLDEESGVYSTFYRSYDPTIGRFQGVDPLADNFSDVTPYQFAGNDPVNLNDPTGAFETNAFGDVYLKPGRGIDSFGYGGGIYNTSIGDGDSNPWATTRSTFSSADAYFDKQWLQNTAGRVLNLEFGIGASWDNNHNSFGYYAEANWTGETINQSTMLAEVGIGVKFISLALGEARNFWDSPSAASKGFAAAGVIDGLFDIGAGYSLIELGKKASAGAEAASASFGVAGAVIALGLARYEYVTHQADSHTVVNLGIAGVNAGLLTAGLVASAMGATVITAAVAPVAVAVGVATLIYAVADIGGNISGAIDEASNHRGRKYFYGK